VEHSTPFYRKDAEKLEALENIETRRSIRSYDSRPVDRETLDRVLTAAQFAPSWKNTQTAGYIVVESPEMKAKVLSALPDFNARTAATAPILVIMTARRGRCGYDRDGSFTTKKGDRWEMFDSGIACQTLCLAAWDQGLGTCIMGIYDEEQLPQLLDLPEDRYITAVVTLGYPTVSPECPARKPLAEKVRYV
jgi:nitroreductase